MERLFSFSVKQLNMEQRDVIKDQIEQLGRVLGKIIANFMGLKTQGNTNEAIQITNKELQSELDLDIDKLIQLELRDITEYIELKRLTDIHLEQLSNYLIEIGMYKKTCYDSESSVKYFMAAKRLLELADKKSSTITFDRISLRRKIENEL